MHILPICRLKRDSSAQFAVKNIVSRCYLWRQLTSMQRVFGFFILVERCDMLAKDTTRLTFCMHKAIKSTAQHITLEVLTSTIELLHLRKRRNIAPKLSDRINPRQQV